ncbi:hypothetical protein RCH10_000202 [Variovorax sp. GrIS 2.14]
MDNRFYKSDSQPRSRAADLPATTGPVAPFPDEPLHRADA